MNALAEPEVLKCYFDEGFQPHLPAMRLRWRVDRGGPSERIWYLPDGVCLMGPAPEQFGVNIHRRAVDAYTIRLVWNKTRLSWPSLKRMEIMTSALAPLLEAMGTNLSFLLDQPVSAQTGLPRDPA
jgi:hypothetical protein